VEVKQEAGKNMIHQCRVAMMGVGDMPLRLNQIELLLNGYEYSSELVAQAQEQIFQDLEPRPDLQSSAKFKKHLASHLFTKVMHQAWERALSFNTRKNLS
jgi:carbon-monoxide dehydrogenase medium subunit